MFLSRRATVLAQRSETVIWRRSPLNPTSTSIVSFRPVIQRSNLSSYIHSSSLHVGALGQSLCGVRRRVFFPNHLPIVPSRAAADHQVHDWLVLIEREVKDIWRSDSSIIKVLFVVTRYGPFFDMPITITSKPGTVGVEGMLTCRSVPP